MRVARSARFMGARSCQPSRASLAQGVPVRRSVSDTLPVKTAGLGLKWPVEALPVRASIPHRGPECPLEGRPQHRIRLGHRNRDSEIDEAGDAVLPDPAGDDAGEMGEIRVNVEADAVIRYPAADSDPDGGDLVFRRDALVGPADPDADPVLAPLAADVELGERPDQPGLECCHVAAQVRPTPV